MNNLLTIVFIFLACQVGARELMNIKFIQLDEDYIFTNNSINDNPYQQYAVKVFFSENMHKKFSPVFNWHDNMGRVIKAESHQKTYFDAKAKNEELPKDTFASYTETATGLPFDMVAIKGGTFSMGSPESELERADDEVQHSVTVSDFYMGKNDVTQAEYKAIMGNNPVHDDGVGDNYPVYYVSWYDAIEFCNALSQKAGLQPYYKIDKNTKDPNNKSKYDKIKWTVTTNPTANGYRLPTEAEWEYAACGGVKSHHGASYKYAGSSDIDEVAWYKMNSNDKCHIVGEKKPNELGIYDMSGNVWEWCWDWYDEYNPNISNNPTGSISGSTRVIRGGNWFSLAKYCRSAKRNRFRPDPRSDSFGFRLSRNK